MTVLTWQIRAWRQADEIRAFCKAARASTLVDPPAGREVLRELAKIDVYAYPWPFDTDGRWTLPDDRPTNPRV